MLVVIDRELSLTDTVCVHDESTLNSLFDCLSEEDYVLQSSLVVGLGSLKTSTFNLIDALSSFFVEGYYPLAVLAMGLSAEDFIKVCVMLGDDYTPVTPFMWSRRRSYFLEDR